jgi:hypothetical protein
MMWEDGKDIVLFNANGIFRIRFDAYPLSPVAWKINDPGPLAPLTSQTLLPGAIYTYWGLYTMSLLIGDVYTNDRTSSLMDIYQQSCPNGVYTGTQQDYAVMLATTAVQPGAQLDWATFTMPAGSKGWTHFTLWRTRNISPAGQALGNLPYNFIWALDVPIGKAFKASRALNTGVITASVGTFDETDAGNTILWSDGSTDIIAVVNSSTQVTSQFTGTAALSNLACGIGVGTAGHISGNVLSAAQSGINITVSASQPSYSLTSADEGKVIFWADGGVSIIKNVITSTTAIAGRFQNHSSQPAVLNASTRVVADTTTDDTLTIRLNSGDSFYLLENELSTPLPSSAIGCVGNGSLISATNNELDYCDTDTNYLTGYHRQDEQHIDKMWGNVQEFRVLLDRIIIRTTTSTFEITTTSPTQGGNTAIGESFFVLPDPAVVDNSIGVNGRSSVLLSNGNEIVLTQEPALKTFNGTQYSANEAEGRFQREIAKFKRPVFMSYSPARGLLIWGYQDNSNQMVCICFGVDALQQGGGFSIRSGDSWVTPESQGAIATIYNGTDRIEVVFDAKSGLPYQIDTRNGPAGSELVEVYKDKVDPLVLGSGSDIPWNITFGEFTGDRQHYYLTLFEFYLSIRPVYAYRCGASGYQPNGLPNGFIMNTTVMVDGVPAPGFVAQSLNVPANNDVFFDRQVKGHTVQIALAGTGSEFKTRTIETKLKASDYPADAQELNEPTAQDLSCEPVSWITRESNLLDRANGQTIAGEIDLIAGPDGNSDSAFLLMSDVQLNNAAQSSGSIVLWRKL